MAISQLSIILSHKPYKITDSKKSIEGIRSAIFSLQLMVHTEDDRLQTPSASSRRSQNELPQLLLKR